MYKVCFADDEVMNHQLLENLVDWKEKGFEIAGTATDGIEALQMYEAIRPDVIFIDIRMPLMDGLECIKMIREEDIAVKIVIVSAYGDFTYAQKAIQYGVQDFLVKPVSRIVLNSLIDKIKQSLLQRTQQGENSTDELELHYMKIRKEIMDGNCKLLRGKFTEFFERVKCAVYIRCMTFEGKAVGWEETESLKELLEKMLQEAGKQFVLVLIEGAGRVLILSGAKRGHAGLLENLQKSNHNRILDIFLTEEAVDEDGLCHYFYDLYHSENPGFYKNEGIIYRGNQNQCFYEPVEEFEADLPLHEILSNDGNDKLNDFFHTMIQKAGEEALNPRILKNRILDILVAMKLKFKKYYPKETFFILRNISMEELNKIDKASYLEQYMQQIVKQIYQEWHKIWQDESREKLMVIKANIYTEEHFTNADFSVRQVAEHIGMSRNYFVTVYKETAHTGFWDYVTERRIEKAKELLITTEDTAGNIARSVGYASEYHFSRKFKEITGMTPNKYRKWNR